MPRPSITLSMALVLASGLAVTAASPPDGAVPALPGVTAAHRPAHGVGVTLPVGGAAVVPTASAAPALPPAIASVTRGAPWVVVDVPWERIEPEPGRYDLSALEADARSVAAADGALIVAFHGGHPLYGRWGASGFEAPAARGADAGALAAYRRAWLRMLRAVASAPALHPAWFELCDAFPGAQATDAARLVSFEIKAASVALRAEQPSAGIAVRVLAEDDVELLVTAYAESGDLAPYVDAVARVAGAADDPAAVAVALRESLLPPDPGASIWVEVHTPTGAAPADEAVARVLDALAGRADLAFASPSADPAQRETVTIATRLSALARALGPSLGSTPAATAGLAIGEGSPAVRWLPFYDERGGRELFVFWGRAETSPTTTAALLLDTALRRRFEVFDPLGVGVDVTREDPADAGRVRLFVSLYRRPLMLLVERSEGEGRAPVVKEEASVRGAHAVTADEIIAAHRAWRAFQDERLIDVTREGSISFRARFAQVTGTFEIAVKGDYLWDRVQGADWTLRETFFNGVRLNWDKFPEIPFISREKVVALPLDLAFDKRYEYRLEGTEEVDGHACWKLRFTPIDERVSLYRGRAFIDQRTAALVKVTTLQTGLKPPMTSDEETQLFRPFEGPDGTTYWLLDEIDGQQLYSVTGSNVVVQRSVRFGAPRINDPGFEARRREAYASTRQMLRETAEGFKWLTREPDGTRRLLEKGNPKQLFAVAGIFKDESVERPLPLGGINYTNLDWRGKGTLLNVFFAGALASVSISHPGLLGTRLDGGFTANLVGFARQDRFYDQAVELEEQRLRVYEQNLRGNIGIPLGEFVKLKGSLDLAITNYHADDTTVRFRAPSDGVESIGTLDLTYDRAGWGLLVRGGTGHRSTWEPWGPEDDLISADDARTHRNYRWYAFGFTKAFFLPMFQKIEVQGTYQAGRDLDRFSKFQFGPFGGARVHGFGGAGIRYDRGLVASFGYSFNLRDVIRFDASIDQARVFDPAIADGMSNHTGLGFAANFIGPWRTFVRIDAGYGLRSDLPAARGGKELTLVVLKLF